MLKSSSSPHNYYGIPCETPVYVGTDALVNKVYPWTSAHFWRKRGRKAGVNEVAAATLFEPPWFRSRFPLGLLRLAGLVCGLVWRNGNLDTIRHKGITSGLPVRTKPLARRTLPRG